MQLLIAFSASESSGRVVLFLFSGAFPIAQRLRYVRAVLSGCATSLAGNRRRRAGNRRCLMRSRRLTNVAAR